MNKWRMKLKERVILIALVSCCILVYIKYKSSKGIIDIVTDGIINEDSQTNQFHVETAHYHQGGVKNIKSRELSKPIDSMNKNKDDKSRELNSLNNEDQKLESLGKIVNEEVHPWDMWWSMVSERHVTKPNAESQIEKILKALVTTQIVEADVGHRGTQLKASLLLDGPERQKVVFKPMRYPREHIIVGNIYDGFDRHNGEIAAFHLDRILGFYRAPPVIGRRIDLENELKPVASQKLLKTFFKNEKQDVCFYGVCYYCKKSEAACAKGNIMEGSVTIWLPHGWELNNNRHPWQRTYRNNKKARWELNPNYCSDIMNVSPYDSGPRLLDIMDTAIFDFLIGNGDRHHYETFKKSGSRGMLLHLDNAKSFGNHFQDEMSILAPIEQCCRIRGSTYKRLKRISTDSSSPDSLSSRLQNSLLSDPVSPVLSELHLSAVDRRLKIVVNVVEKCIQLKEIKNVVIKDEF